MNLPECRLPKTHKEIVRIMVSSIPNFKDGQATSNTKARAPLPGFSGVIWDEWGKKGVRMDTKALKKQMGAAIAMVLVAAVALGSATFAWFVSNNKVEAKTSSIAAQSNSAYLVIDNAATSKTSNSSVISAQPHANLYPAKVVKENGNAVWKSAYADKADAATMKTGSEFKIDDGTAEKAATANYAVKNTFYVGTGGYDGEFTNLHITGVTVTNPTTDVNKNLGDALRVLVVYGDKWEVWSAAGIKLSSSVDNPEPNSKGSDLLAEKEVINSGHDAEVKVYLYYDGDEANVYSNNLDKIKTTAGDNSVTITFEATPKEYAKASN